MIKSRRTERGQALVIVVFAILALLVVAGLAIDGGMVFLERRRMQNAADAGALAGTRVLVRGICGEAGTNDAAVAAEVNHYAQVNGVKDVANNVVADYVNFNELVLGRVGNGTIPNGAAGISVTTRIQRATYFVTLLGIDTAGASAGALAMSGRPLVGSGVRPFGIPRPVVVDLDSGDCFSISFGQNCDDPDQCNVVYTGGQVQHRGWMNLDYVWRQQEEGAGFPRAQTHTPAGQLKTWMQYGCDDTTLYADGLWSQGYRNGDYVHAGPGTEQDVINVAPIGELIYVPVFDAFPDCDGEEPDIAEPHPEDACRGGQGADYYHIVGFAGVRVQGTSTPNHSIDLCLEQTIWGQGQPSPNSGYGSNVCAMHTMVVALWR